MEVLIEDLCCLCSNKSNLEKRGDKLYCSNSSCLHSESGNGFNISDNTPILVCSEICDTLVDEKNIRSFVKRKNKISKNLKDLLFRNKITEKNLAKFINLISTKSKLKPKILIIGSGEVGNSSSIISDNENLNIYGIDVYNSESVDIICDAHYLPFCNEIFDGVIIQAVLEHVVDPAVVISEIHRILKDSGTVYSEVPFMQYIHEGAYDFSRYTVSGHRYLFKYFTAIDCGPLNGIETSLAWSIRQALFSIFGKRRIISIISVPIFIVINMLKFIESKNTRYDSCSGTYFLGNKSKKAIKQKELLSFYKN
jgi:SAM-dependent methyltransferase